MKLTFTGNFSILVKNIMALSNEISMDFGTESRRIDQIPTTVQFIKSQVHVPILQSQTVVFRFRKARITCKSQWSYSCVRRRRFLKCTCNSSKRLPSKLNNRPGIVNLWFKDKDEKNTGKREHNEIEILVRVETSTWDQCSYHTEKPTIRWLVPCRR